MQVFVALFGADAAECKSIAEFIPVAERAILDRVDFIDSQTELAAHETILLKIGRRGVRRPRVKIFTTNYDLAFEFAAQRRRFVVMDGFSYSTPQVYDRMNFAHDIVRRDGTKDGPDYLESVFQLYKLHGSLDWRKAGTEVVRSRDPEAQPVLIYPRDSKYQEAFDPPFLDMMAAFQASLRAAETTLIISGFGFNDGHIGGPILAALESNMSLRLIVCDPVFIDEAKLDGDPAAPVDASPNDLKNEYHRKLMRLAQTGDSRLALLNGRFEDLANALPDLIAQTERERHAERVRALRTLESEDRAGA